MRDLLFISYYFPPQPEAGAVRGGALAKYLAEFGWRPTVVGLASEPPPPFAGDFFPARNLLVPAIAPVRPDPSAATSARASNARSLRTLVPAPLRRLYWSSTQWYFPDAAMGWIPTAFAAAGRARRARRFAAILSSAHPPSAHLVAGALARRWRVPWVADYRDLWTGYPYSRRSALRRALERRVERAVVGRAASLTTVSEPLAAELRRLFPRTPVFAIPNGVEIDRREDDEAPPAGFRLMFAGTLYYGRRSPDVAFAAVRLLQERRAPVAAALAFDFYGGDEELVRRAARQYGVSDMVTTHGRVDRASVLAAQRRAAVLLVLQSTDPATTQEYGSKIFEYVAARRPVLVVGPPDSVLRTYVAESGIGLFAHDAASCADALERLYGRYERGQYDAETRPGWRPFTTRDLTARFAEVLDRVVADASAPRTVRHTL